MAIPYTFIYLAFHQSELIVNYIQMHSQHLLKF